MNHKYDIKNTDSSQGNHRFSAIATERSEVGD